GQTTEGRIETELSGGNWNLWLDQAAQWSNDEIYLPPVDISKLPTNPPTCGWEGLESNSGIIKVDVPGTVEEHYWGRIGVTDARGAGDYVGVSWWSRKFPVSENLKGKRVTIAFQSVNMRAEIFVNQKLMGYDVIGNTPFEVDITDAVIFGGDNQLDIRITDPVGNFAWDDNGLMAWGENLIPAVHGFGGITGKVLLRITDDVVISDIYVENQPDPKEVNMYITVDNFTQTPQNGTLSVKIHEKGNPNAEVWEESSEVELPRDGDVFSVSAKVPQAKLWELYDGDGIKETNLYEASVTITSEDNEIVDNHKQRFGFRWFEVGEKNGDKRFYLNGKRVFVIAAMTRGFWPKNGIFPTEEMKKRDAEAMFDLGMNTMLMHRAIGQPGVFEYADENGFFTYEEPGGYRVTPNRRAGIEGPDEQAYKLREEKLRRMVIRDRSFPSLIIYNLKNEATNPPIDKDIEDMKMVHELDPGRVITYNSGSDQINSDVEYFNYKPNDPFELHMLPFNQELIYGGWWDQHHWYPYSGYHDEMYQNPRFFVRGVINGARSTMPTDSLYRLPENKVLFFGEEGAFGTMLRLQKIAEEVKQWGATGFREMEHVDWFESYDKFLDETGFRAAYPNVDSLTKSLGRNLHYFQGRNIESVRIGNVGDAYNMNGWASGGTRTDVVGMYRHPTADKSIISHYTQPLYVAVKLRNKVIQVGTETIVDFFIVNQMDISGRHVLKMDVVGPDGNSVFQKEFNVRITGGEEFGELLVEGVKLPVVDAPGYYMVNAVLEKNGQKVTDGFDDIYAVDLENDIQGLSCAVLDNSGNVKEFINKETGASVVDYSSSIPKVDVIIIGDYEYDSIEEASLQDIFNRVSNGAKLIVLSDAIKFVSHIDNLLNKKPTFLLNERMARGGGSGRLFVGLNPVLEGLPQAQGMSWEYQCFYKGHDWGESAQVEGISLNTFGTELIVAMGNQGSKEIASALSNIPVGEGVVTLSTLNFIPNLLNKERSSV
ncbi:MAG TPA: glycoside hydrolase family 2 TIM barrel-domain containing protein, partial [Draconibacterium sp.]|nr:glycoside hydrolase family 2 TIM barrel-domain containing protein [Draconibacterium sp.]